jgi:tetratricopeptide (TPR) repeat protein
LIFNFLHINTFCIHIQKLKFPSLDELLLQRIDGLDDFTRKTLQLASILGKTFSANEIYVLLEHASSIMTKDTKSSNTKTVRISLDIAVQDGILDESVPDEDVNVRIENLEIDHLPDNTDEEDSESRSVRSWKETIYTFCHDSWRQKILSLMLDSYKKDIHKHAANALESTIPDIEEADYRTKMRLFTHLKGSGDTYKAATLAMDIGKNFSNLGLNSQSIEVLNLALDMWRKEPNNDDESADSAGVSGILAEIIESLDETELVSVIKLLTALGRAIGTQGNREDSLIAFEDALEVSSSRYCCSILCINRLYS